jgi:hypothetical protein
MQQYKIMLDHLNCGINSDQACKWGIEWDTCGPGLLCRVASKRSYLRSRLFFQNRLRTRMTQSWNFSPVAHIALKKQK